jgi:hypothetical protein
LSAEETNVMLHYISLLSTFYLLKGTGDVAFRVADAMTKAYGTAVTSNLSAGESALLTPSKRQIVVCDINPEMLAVGRQRAPLILGARSDMVSIHCMLPCLLSILCVEDALHSTECADFVEFSLVMSVLFFNSIISFQN